MRCTFHDYIYNTVRNDLLCKLKNWASFAERLQKATELGIIIKEIESVGYRGAINNGTQRQSLPFWTKIRCLLPLFHSYLLEGLRKTAYIDVCPFVD